MLSCMINSSFLQNHTSLDLTSQHFPTLHLPADIYNIKVLTHCTLRKFLFLYETIYSPNFPKRKFVTF